MIIFDKQSKHKVSDIDLHDAEVHEIFCNYTEHKIRVPLKLHNPTRGKVEAELNFEDVLFVDISLCEPWGAGFYINEIIVSNDTMFISKFDDPEKYINSIHLTILLNSGDKINVVASKILYLEK
ncbi:hypothetical protein SAMN04487897_107181 [Paenibacillus sp. yr247]|uniref:hypothetical protein n=1 Tax=Paenibacillus sp. yr247 TaxID=1761880 RepID=UPI00087FE3D2|nr:hypothetical protein [Paenibacillus sp. yr247]SDO04602.1 hypothetical protein SAMN04487897_107181 [Paenibacillus sp. yr247]